MQKRLDPAILKDELARLANEASSIDKGLASRLEDFKRWVGKKKDGLLRCKPLVVDFLSEVILDANIYLKLQALSDEQQRQAVLSQMTLVERYWYNELLSTWLNELDPKLSVWKQKLMSGEFSQDDENLLNALHEKLESRGAGVLRRYILDLSMATDMLVVGKSGKLLYVQVTTVADVYSEDKRNQWKLTLGYWGIKSGLFVSYKPSQNFNDVTNLAEFILQRVDDDSYQGYSECNV